MAQPQPQPKETAEGSIGTLSAAEWSSVPKYLKTAKISLAAINEYICTINEMSAEVQRLIRTPTSRLSIEAKDRVYVRSVCAVCV